MSRQFVLASNNQHKILEFTRILKPLGISMISAKEAGIDFSNVEESGSTFSENARLKAMYAFEKCGLPCIADDSGLCVNALGGRPGVYSARYGGKGSSDDEKINLLLSELKAVSSDDRSAYFACSICCVLDINDIIEVQGISEGYIGFEKKGDNGFGYDPIFCIKDGRAFAELTAEEKDVRSHRGFALKELFKVLSDRKEDV